MCGSGFGVGGSWRKRAGDGKSGRERVGVVEVGHQWVVILGSRRECVEGMGVGGSGSCAGEESSVCNES